MKLHLGCGQRFIEGWIHIDALDSLHIDHVCEIDDLSFISDSTVDLIYASHVLEHFTRSRTWDVLKEWVRTLKPGGTLRLAVPDFAVLASLYIETSNIEIVKGPVCGRQNNKYNIHYNIFDEASLGRLMQDSGLHNIHRWDWRTTEHSDVDDFSQAYYPHLDKQNGRLLSLNLEGYKPL